MERYYTREAALQWPNPRHNRLKNFRDYGTEGFKIRGIEGKVAGYADYEYRLEEETIQALGLLQQPEDPKPCPVCAYVPELKDMAKVIADNGVTAVLEITETRQAVLLATGWMTGREKFLRRSCLMGEAIYEIIRHDGSVERWEETAGDPRQQHIAGRIEEYLIEWGEGNG